MLEMLRQRDRRTAAQILHHHHWMHVRFPGDRRSITELRRNESHGCDDILLALRLTLPLPQLCQHGRRTERSTPGTEVLGGVREVGDPLDVFVDVAGMDILPLSTQLVAEQTRPWRLQ